MRITLSKDFPYQIMFFVAVGITYFNIYELSLAIWLLLAVVTIKRYYSVPFLWLVASFVAIFVIAFSRTFFYDHNTYNIIRDIAYFIKPIIGLIIGYQCFRGSDNNFFKVVLYISLILAVIHLCMVGHAVLFKFLKDLMQIRAHAGFFSDFETFGLIVVLFHKKFNLNLSKRAYWIYLLIIGLSLLFYFARTNMIQFVMVALGMLGLYTITQKKLTLLAVFGLVSVLGFQWVVSTNPTRNAPGIEGFLYKVKNAPREIYDPYVVNDNTARFHDNFRSYETQVTILQMLSRDDLGIWLGNGLGATVNYGRLMWTTESSRVRHAPILHNGYTTVFLKAGIIGLLFFFWSMLFLFFYGKRSSSTYLNNIKLLINSTGLFLFVSTLVFLGLYFKMDNKSLFIGGLLAYYEIQRKLLSDNAI